MGKLFVAAMSPLVALWSMAESRIWITIGVLAVLAAAAGAAGRIGVAMSFLGLLSLFLMRAETVLDAQKAARGA